MFLWVGDRAFIALNSDPGVCSFRCLKLAFLLPNQEMVVVVLVVARFFIFNCDPPAQWKVEDYS